VKPDLERFRWLVSESLASGDLRIENGVDAVNLHFTRTPAETDTPAPWHELRDRLVNGRLSDDEIKVLRSMFPRGLVGAVRPGTAVLVSAPRPGSFQRFWRLFSYLLPSSTRARVFEPAYQELLEDYVTTRKLYRTKAARRWLFVCFTFRSVLMVVRCFLELGKSKAVRLLLSLVPGRLKEWLS
jgi:hypothetical protein